MNIKKKKGGEGGANWMDTYGDMVTLLLCFFVLLYSMSTIDEKKWQMIVMSFNPNVTSVPSQSIPQGPDGSNSSGGGPGDAPTEDQMEEILKEMYLALDEYIKESNMESSVAVTNGDGYVFLTFRDAVFFGPNSSVLLDEGKDVLREVAPMFLNAQEYIQEIRVMGHTAREIPTQPNSPAFDRTLSANRAAGVGTFLQEQGIDGAKVITVGYGEWRPIDNNTSSEGRAHNRRVEIMVTGLELEEKLQSGLQQYETVVDDARTEIQKEWGLDPQ